MTTTYETANLNHAREMAVSAKYSPDFKREAVRIAKGGQGLPATATALGISAQTLQCWIESHPESQLMTIGKQVITPDEAEIDRLKGELTMDKMEIALLENTIAFFDKVHR